MVDCDPILFGSEFGDEVSVFADPPSGTVRRVAPVGVGREGDSKFMLNQLFKESAIPKFSGEVCDFENFRWNFNRYLQRVEDIQGNKIKEEFKVYLLEKALPTFQSQWLQQMQQEGQAVTCRGFLALMETKFCGARENQVRQKWDSLRCIHEGKMRGHDLQKFELEFRQLRKELPTLSDEEAHRHLMRRLPQHMVNWVAEEEVRIKSDRPRVVWTVPEESANAQIAESVEEMVGARPTEVRKVQPKVFVITFADERSAAKMLEMNGRAIEGCRMRMHVRPAGQHMSLDEVFKFLHSRLESREKADGYIRTGFQNENRWRSPNRDPRYVRVTDVDDDSETDDDRESESENRSRNRRSKGRGRNRSVSPAHSDRGAKSSSTPPCE